MLSECSQDRDSVPARVRGHVDVSVVIPCLNEARTIGCCVDKARRSLRDLGVRGEIIVVDNRSTDGSAKIAEAHGARVVTADGRGYGLALSAGIEAARGSYIIMGDADDAHELDKLGPFIHRLEEGYDLIVGNRFLGGIRPGAMPWLHRYVGNPLLTGLLNLFFHSPIHDAHCGLRAFRRDAIVRLRLSSPGMEFASEMVVKACLGRLSMTEVPTVLHPDGRDRPPHLRSFRDGWRHLRLLLLLCPTWLYLIPSALLSLGGILLMYWHTPGPRRLGVAMLDLQGMLIGAACVIIGYQNLWMWLCARASGVASWAASSRPRASRSFPGFSLERCLLAGGGLCLTGLAVCLHSAVEWLDRDLGPLEIRQAIRCAVWGMMALVLGLQTIYGGFLTTLLGTEWSGGLSSRSVVPVGAPPRIIGAHPAHEGSTTADAARGA
jgi:glycosyltransferase involved in cell wall biosynthesis